MTLENIFCTFFFFFEQTFSNKWWSLCWVGRLEYSDDTVRWQSVILLNNLRQLLSFYLSFFFFCGRKIKTIVIEKDFAFILCSDKANLAETQQDQSLIVQSTVQTWRKSVAALGSFLVIGWNRHRTGGKKMLLSDFNRLGTEAHKD